MATTKALGSALLVVFLLNVSEASHYSKPCSDYTTCSSCSRAKQAIGWFKFNCYWCPLDRRCHVAGTLKTPCLSSMNVKDPGDCPSESYRTYDREKAFRATLLSAAAFYGNPQKCLNSIASSGKFDVKDVILTPCDVLVKGGEPCLSFVGVSTHHREIFVVFRGSVGFEQHIDQFLVTLSKPYEYSDIGGKAHAYFYNAYKELYGCVRQSVSSLVGKYPSYRVLVTGNSLGGAIASLTAASLVRNGAVAKTNLDLYTTGMPKVGDKNYAYNHDQILESSWNVVHFRDIVPHLPPCNLLTGCNFPWNMPFHHRTEVYYKSMTEGKNSAYVVCHENEDAACSNGAMMEEPCFDMAKCAEYHQNYFGIHLSSHCANKAGSSPNIWGDIASGSTCKAFPN